MKARIFKENNPDYWEPSRGLKKDGMEKPSKQELQTVGNKNESRWDLINKNIVYCDFKEYVSAFDMFFYYYEFKPMGTIKTKQDFIRSRSKHLALVFSNNYDSYKFYGTERIESCRELNKETCEAVSRIMDQEYSEIKIVTHKLYAKDNNVKALKTILMKKEKLDHTEAFAGSGESRLIMLVDDILSAENKSLILIDEPEINLHPRALIHFQEFLLEQILKKSHQIVISIHSHFLIDKLPKESIKLFQRTESGIAIIENVYHIDAFLELGEEIDKRVQIFVEDRLVKEIIEARIRESKNNSLKKIIQVVPLSGGVKNIIKNHIHSSLRGEVTAYYVLDGDQNHLENRENEGIDPAWIENGFIHQERIPISNNERLGDIIKNITDMDIKFCPSSGKNSNEEIYQMQRQFLDYWKTNVRFLNSTTPENALLESLDENNGKKSKEKYLDKTQKFMGKKEVSSEEILFLQKHDISRLEDTCLLNIKVDEILKYINIKILDLK